MKAVITMGNLVKGFIIFKHLIYGLCGLGILIFACFSEVFYLPLAVWARGILIIIAVGLFYLASRKS